MSLKIYIEEFEVLAEEHLKLSIKFPKFAKVMSHNIVKACTFWIDFVWRV
jgi:hypothetical protein